MKIFIGIKYNEEALSLVPKIKEILERLGHNPYCFAKDEGYIADEKKIMEKAFQKIDESDLIIIEASQVAFGVGIEAGYSFAKGKKIIVISNESEKFSSTLKGTCDLYLSYKDFNELEKKLRDNL